MPPVGGHPVEGHRRGVRGGDVRPVQGAAGGVEEERAGDQHRDHRHCFNVPEGEPVASGAGEGDRRARDRPISQEARREAADRRGGGEAAQAEEAQTGEVHLLPRRLPYVPHTCHACSTHAARMHPYVARMHPVHWTGCIRGHVCITYVIRMQHVSDTYVDVCRKGLHL